MYTPPATMSANAEATARWVRRADRHAIDLLARFAWKGLRGTVLLKDLTADGARIEGLEALRQGDGLTLLLPDAPPVEATVCWALGRAAGLRFDEAIASDELARIIRDFAPATLSPLTPSTLARHTRADGHRLCA